MAIACLVLFPWACEDCCCEQPVVLPGDWLYELRVFLPWQPLVLCFDLDQLACFHPHLPWRPTTSFVGLDTLFGGRFFFFLDIFLSVFMNRNYCLYQFFVGFYVFFFNFWKWDNNLRKKVWIKFIIFWLRIWIMVWIN